MYNYPEVVAKIANDYLERVRLQLRTVPARERDEFLREIESHLYEAYQNTPGDDAVARILAVMRNFGEPAEVVADRLPGAMVRSGIVPHRHKHQDEDAAAATTPVADDSKVMTRFAYLTPDRFRVAVSPADQADRAINLIMDRKGLFSWRLEQIELPGKKGLK